MRLVIGSRKSDLARLQTYRVVNALKSIEPSLEFDLRFSSSLGDRDLDTDLRDFADKGVFTQDFHDDLVAGKLDMVIHSWKDLQVEEQEGTEVLGTMSRADQRDVLLIKKSTDLSGPIEILTSSPRRIYNLQSAIPMLLPKGCGEINFSAIRGNIPTRISKLMNGNAHGLVLAKAALDRMLSAKEADLLEPAKQLRDHLLSCHWMILPLEVCPTAAAQGALAIEVGYKCSSEIRELILKINCPQTYKLVQKERRMLTTYGGGCHQKIGISCALFSWGEVTWLKGETDDGEVLNFHGMQESFDIPRNQAWPLNRSNGDFFKRQSLSHNQSEFNKFDLFVTKSLALPHGVEVSADHILWTPGLKTWKKLAERGYWVNGTSESLGEDWGLNVQEILGREPRWLKLNHETGMSSINKQLKATYRLVATEDISFPEEKEHFYWRSASQFQYALNLHPSLSKKQHYCGPGNSFAMISSLLPAGASLRPVLNFESWLEHLVDLK